MPRVAVFDLDGTLADSAPAIARALNQSRAARGLPALAVERFRPWISHGAPALVGAALELGVPADAQAVEAFRDVYRGCAGSPEDLYPGIGDAVARLHGAGVVMGVCTNKPQLLSEKVLSETGLARYFTAVVGGDRTARPKPDPAHLRQTLVEMGCTADTPFSFIGDSLIDAQAAAAAGARFLLASWGYADADDLSTRGVRLDDAAALIDAVLGPAFG